MPCHCENEREHRRGAGRRLVLERMIMADLSSMAPCFPIVPCVPILLDTGDTDEFTFTSAGGVACFCGFRPHGQNEITVVA
ncbi:hypothetical protein ACVDG5_023975 [Mesorhizobium sp. ORM6]